MKDFNHKLIDFSDTYNQIQNIINQSSNYVFFKDKNLRYVMVNNKFAQYQGLNIQDIIGQTDEDIVKNPKLLEKYKDQDIQVLSSKNKIEFPVVKYIEKNGNVSYTRSIKSIIYNCLGFDELLYCTTADVTNIILQEHEKRKESMFYEMLFENNLDGIVVYDQAQNKFTKFNNRTLEILKCTKEEFETSGLFNFLPEYQPNGVRSEETIKNDFEKIKIHGKNRTEIQIKRKDHSFCMLDVTAYQLDISQPNTFVAMFKDITEQSKILEKTIEDNERFRTLFEKNPSGVAITDLKGRIISTNRAFEKLLGYTSKELHHLEIKKLSPVEDFQENENYRQLCINGEIDNFKIQKQYFQKNGSIIYGKLTSGIVRDKNGKPLYFIGIVNDITENIKRQNELDEQNTQLKKINEELNNLVYRTSHDLRSPITSLLGLTNLFEEEPENMEMYLEMMRNQLMKLDNVIKDIIDYRKVGTISNKKERIDFNQIIQDKFEQMKFLPHYEQLKKDIVIEQECYYYNDPYLIEILFNNFISNAIKYSDFEKKESFIKIQISINKEQVRIYVEDNGIGIENEFQNKIFDMFYRATQLSQGTGLGLYMVKEIVEKLNGTISCQSVLGKGTSFEVILPHIN